jgi:hypothetical protein
VTVTSKIELHRQATSDEESSSVPDGDAGFTDPLNVIESHEVSFVTQVGNALLAGTTGGGGWRAVRLGAEWILTPQFWIVAGE